MQIDTAKLVNAFGSEWIESFTAFLRILSAIGRCLAVFTALSCYLMPFMCSRVHVMTLLSE